MDCQSNHLKTVRKLRTRLDGFTLSQSSTGFSKKPCDLRTKDAAFRACYSGIGDGLRKGYLHTRHQSHISQRYGAQKLQLPLCCCLADHVLLRLISGARCTNTPNSSLSQKLCRSAPSSEALQAVTQNPISAVSSTSLMSQGSISNSHRMSSC